MTFIRLRDALSTNPSGDHVELSHGGFQGRVLMTISALLLTTALTSCDSGNSNSDEEDPSEIEWNYDNKGPDRWMNIAPEWAICGNGTRQSPIDISVDPGQDLGALFFAYSTSRLNVHNDAERTVHLAVDTGSSIRLDGVDYTLESVHFHVPAEHTIDGATFPGEVHFVHEGPSGEVLYVAILIASGEDNKGLTDVISNLPTEAGDPMVVTGVFYDLNEFLPAERTYYRYDGSLTTPPCSEGVEWLVLQHQLTLSSTQIAAMNGIFGGNNRPVQPLNGREIAQN